MFAGCENRQVPLKVRANKRHGYQPEALFYCLLTAKSQNHALLRLREIIQRSATELAFLVFAHANQTNIPRYPVWHRANFMQKNPHSGGLFNLGYLTATGLFSLDKIKANRACSVQKVDNS